MKAPPYDHLANAASTLPSTHSAGISFARDAGLPRLDDALRQRGQRHRRLGPGARRIYLRPLRNADVARTRRAHLRARIGAAHDPRTGRTIRDLTYRLCVVESRRSYSRSSERLSSKQATHHIAARALR